MNELDQLLEQLNNSANLSNPSWLADTSIKLSIFLYNLGDKVAEAELVENQTTLTYLDQTLMEGEKKISVAEAEKRGLSETGNNYGRLKLKYQSLVEIIQSTKKKIDSTNQQMKSGI